MSTFNLPITRIRGAVDLLILLGTSVSNTIELTFDCFRMALDSNITATRKQKNFQD